MFDGAFLPAAVRVTEEGFAWQGLVSSELESIIEGDGFGLEGGDGSPQLIGHSGGSFSIRIVDDEQESRFSLDGGDEVVFLFFEVHKIGLPVVIMVAVVNVVISFVNRDSALYFASMFAASSLGSSWFFAP